MGTWISHLRIAEQLTRVLPGLDEAAFIFGSLAPDSGLPNADWSVFDPPKEVTHFLYKGEGENAIRDVRFYRQYLAAMRRAPDGFVYSFRLGYFIHLLCDNLWAKKVWVPTEKACQNEIRADQAKAFGNIKFDWYGLDQVYVKHHPECAFWRVLAVQPNPDSCLPFIPNAAFHHQMDYIRGFYSHPDDEWFAPRKYPYLNETTMSRFVEDGVGIMQAVLERLPALEAADGAVESALCLVPDEHLLPYEAPLGDA